MTINVYDFIWPSRTTVNVNGEAEDRGEMGMTAAQGRGTA